MVVVGVTGPIMRGLCAASISDGEQTERLLDDRDTPSFLRPAAVFLDRLDEPGKRLDLVSDQFSKCDAASVPNRFLAMTRSFFFGHPNLSHVAIRIPSMRSASGRPLPDPI